MKLLIITQKVNINDPILGFFHRWIEEFSKHYEKIHVICLEKGEFDLPQNVYVYSLGKEERESKVKYVTRFYKHIWNLRKDYDLVFVHMNQEYILLGGIFWKLFKKPIFLWRNHIFGNFITHIACLAVNKIFYTSSQSFTSRYKNSVRMPAGIPVDNGLVDIPRDENIFLVISRISPIKKILEIIASFTRVSSKMPNAQLHIYGDPSVDDFLYYKEVKKQAEQLPGRIYLKSSVTPKDISKLYRSAGFFINMTGPGSFDKTMLEALLNRTILISNNPNIKEVIENDIFIEKKDLLGEALLKAYHLPIAQKLDLRKKSRRYVLDNHSLDALVNKLMKEMK